MQPLWDAVVLAANAQHHVQRLETPVCPIAVHVVTPAHQPPQGNLLLIHGYFDHVGLMGPALDEGLRAGWRVVAFDLPGHGHSGGARGEIQDFDQYQMVLSAVMDALQAQDPATAALPWVGLGQSTGGGILIDHALRQGDASPFQRLVLLAPLVRIAAWRRIRWAYRLLGRFLSHVPRRHRPQGSTHDPEFNHFIRTQDPLQAAFIPINWLGAALRWGEALTHRPPVAMPADVLFGDQDRTVDWRYNRAAVARLLDVQHNLLLTGASHQILHEIEPWQSQWRAVLRSALAACRVS